MKSLFGKIKRPSVYRFVILAALLCTFAASPLLSSAQPQSATINVVNNSNRQITHLYLSPVDSDNWGADQLNDSIIIGSGQSFTINNVSCNGSQIKVIAEDSDGCFLTGIVTCSADAVWTITQGMTPDCGN